MTSSHRDLCAVELVDKKKVLCYSFFPSKDAVSFQQQLQWNPSCQTVIQAHYKSRSEGQLVHTEVGSFCGQCYYFRQRWLFSGCNMTILVALHSSGQRNIVWMLCLRYEVEDYISPWSLIFGCFSLSHNLRAPFCQVISVNFYKIS